MAYPVDPRLTVVFEQLGRESERVSSFSIDSDYLTATDAFQLRLHDRDPSLIRDLELQPVDLRITTENIQAASQLLGRIETSRGGESASVRDLGGRDYLADLQECCVDPTAKVTADMNLVQAIKAVAGVVGVTEVSTEPYSAMRTVRAGKQLPAGSAAGFTPAKLADSELKPGPGQGIFDFCNRLAARQGCTIQPWRTRNAVCLAIPDYTQPPAFRLYRSADPNASKKSNVIRASDARDFSRFPTHTIVTGKGGGGGKQAQALSYAVDMEAFAIEYQLGLRTALEGKLIGARRKPTDTSALGGKLYRLRYVVDQEARSKVMVEKAALRVVAELVKPTLVYSATVRGFEDPTAGAIWAIDTVVDVVDEVCGIQEPMWVARRTLRYEQGSGATTDLELWRLGTFQLGA